MAGGLTRALKQARALLPLLHRRWEVYLSDFPFAAAVKVASGAVAQARCPRLLRAMGAAVDGAAGLYTVADHPGVAVSAPRCAGLDGAFEAVESHGAAVPGYLEGLVVVIAALIANRHGSCSWKERKSGSGGAGADTQQKAEQDESDEAAEEYHPTPPGAQDDLALTRLTARKLLLPLEL